MNGEAVRNLLFKYYVYSKDFPKDYIIREVKPTDIKLYEQDAGNCRLFTAMNNYILNHNRSIDKYMVKNYIKNKLDMNPDDGFSVITGLNAICDLMNEGMLTYSLDMMKQTKQFAKMLDAGWCFAIAIAINDAVKKDILDNDILDLPMQGKTNHLVNVGFHRAYSFVRYDHKSEKLKIFGTWGDNPMSDFEVSVPVFIESIRKFGIEPNALFIDYPKGILPK